MINAPTDLLLGTPLIGKGTNGAPGTGQAGGPGGLLWGPDGVAPVGGAGGLRFAVGVVAAPAPQISVVGFWVLPAGAPRGADVGRAGRRLLLS